MAEAILSTILTFGMAAGVSLAGPVLAVVTRKVCKATGKRVARVREKWGHRKQEEEMMVMMIKLASAQCAFLYQTDKVSKARFEKNLKRVRKGLGPSEGLENISAKRAVKYGFKQKLIMPEGPDLRLGMGVDEAMTYVTILLSDSKMEEAQCRLDPGYEPSSETDWWIDAESVDDWVR